VNLAEEFGRRHREAREREVQDEISDSLWPRKAGNREEECSMKEEKSERKAKRKMSAATKIPRRESRSLAGWHVFLEGET
jgi:hypothetical protein